MSTTGVVRSVWRNDVTICRQARRPTPLRIPRSAARWITGPSAIGIGERHAQLEDVGAGAYQRMQQRNRERGRRIAAGDIGDEAAAAARAHLREAGGDAAGRRRRHAAGPPRAAPMSFMPPASATMCRSLSPRPLRLTSRTLSAASCGASCAA